MEKQLFDVLLMLLAKAVQNYDLCHEVVMATIDRLNTEMEIKEPLTRALKRQQDLCVQVPVRKIVLHQQFSRIMAGLYNLAQGWSDRYRNPDPVCLSVCQLSFSLCVLPLSLLSLSLSLLAISVSHLSLILALSLSLVFL